MRSISKVADSIYPRARVCLAPSAGSCVRAATRSLSRPVSLGVSVLLGLFFMTASAEAGGSSQWRASASASLSRSALSEVAETSQPSSAGAIDACSLLTQAEVEGTVGTRVLEPRGEQIDEIAFCYYGNPALGQFDGFTFNDIVSLSVHVVGDAAQVRPFFEMATAAAGGVRGLGDGAWWDDEVPFSGGMLNVLKGSYWINIEIAADRGGLNAARELAMKMLDRLP